MAFSNLLRPPVLLLCPQIGYPELPSGKTHTLNFRCFVSSGPPRSRPACELVCVRLLLKYASNKHDKHLALGAEHERSSSAHAHILRRPADPAGAKGMRCHQGQHSTMILAITPVESVSKPSFHVFFYLWLHLMLHDFGP